MMKVGKLFPVAHLMSLQRGWNSCIHSETGSAPAGSDPDPIPCVPAPPCPPWPCLALTAAVPELLWTGIHELLKSGCPLFIYIEECLWPELVEELVGLPAGLCDRRVHPGGGQALLPGNKGQDRREWPQVDAVMLL